MRVVREAVYIGVGAIWEAAALLATGEGEKTRVGRGLQVVRALEEERAVVVESDNEVPPWVLGSKDFKFPVFVEGVRGAGR